MKMHFTFAIILFGCLEPNKELPKILIIGDSISGGYFPFVQESLKGKARFFSQLILMRMEN